MYVFWVFHERYVCVFFWNRHTHTQNSRKCTWNIWFMEKTHETISWKSIGVNDRVVDKFQPIAVETNPDLLHAWLVGLWSPKLEDFMNLKLTVTYGVFPTHKRQLLFMMPANVVSVFVLTYRMCWNNITWAHREILSLLTWKSLSKFSILGLLHPRSVGFQEDIGTHVVRHNHPITPNNLPIPVWTTKTSNLDYTYRLQFVQNMVGSQCPFPHHISGWMIVIYQPFWKIREVPLLNYPLQPILRWRQLYVTNIHI